MAPARAEIALSAGVFALGIAAAAVTASLPSDGGYAGIGPNFVPGLVAAALIGLGIWLLYEALTGGWRRRPEHADVFQPKPFLWLTAGLFAHMALIAWAGFVIAGTVLFVCVARGFGSRAFLRDLAAGVALTLAVFLFFTQVLNVSLPAVWTPFRP